jgi:hypothetical protein
MPAKPLFAITSAIPALGSLKAEQNRPAVPLFPTLSRREVYRHPETHSPVGLALPILHRSGAPSRIDCRLSPEDQGFKRRNS